MNRAHFTFLVCASIGLGACRPKEPTFEEKISASFSKAGLRAPQADGPTIPVPKDGIFVFILRDAVSVGTPDGFASMADTGDMVFPFDRAYPFRGADRKFKLPPENTLIAPLRDVIAMKLSAGATPRVTIAAYGRPPPALYDSPPPALYKEVLETCAASGVTESYRLVWAEDGKLAAERVP